MNPLRTALAVGLCLGAAVVFAEDTTPALVSTSPDRPNPAEGNASGDWNVNSRYIVESVEFPDTQEADFSHRLRDRIQSLAGDKLNYAALRGLAHDIRTELSAHSVSFRIARGSRPDYVRVFFDVDRTHSAFDVLVPKFVWTSGQGWTAIGEATLPFGHNTITVGLLSDGDDLVERFTGARARLTHRWGSDHPVRLVFDFEDYHEEFGRETEAALSSAPGDPGMYHARMDLAPRMEYAVTRELTVSAGTAFESMESQLPGAPSRSANAMTAELRWQHDEEVSEETHKTARISWTLRAATHTLGSDYVYARNELTASWTGVWGRHRIDAGFDAGLISGEAPLFERFVLGNSTMLRGWNKYQLDPVGGSRLAYGTAGYRYRILRAFYDVGAIWDPRRAASPKQSIGVGVGSSFGILQRNELLVAVAFPLQQGRMDPVLIAGMNF
ncbi:MAG TPA: BamA/TamA family outer membrane protein [Bryobacteraceae bacterium]|nr:BamA/TamA family outer membrane protein [Bryobacteraceae bacterium]